MALKLKELPVNKKNPFALQTITHIQKENRVIIASNKPSLIVEKGTGEVIGETLLAKYQKVDKAQFTKIYISSLKRFFDLSKPAVNVFAYIASILEVNKDFFYFNMKECVEFTNYSNVTITKALAELGEKQFIARSDVPRKYFINPTIFFNGDRLTLVSHYEAITEVKGYNPKNFPNLSLFEQQSTDTEEKQDEVSLRDILSKIIRTEFDCPNPNTIEFDCPNPNTIEFDLPNLYKKK